MSDILNGVVDSIIFRNDTNTFHVFRLLLPTSEKTVVSGAVEPPLLGNEVLVKGSWVEHPKFGRQFKADLLEVKLDSVVKGLERYLGSGAVPYVGPTLATRMVACFGKDVLQIMEKTPERLVEVDGIGKVKAAQIHKGFKNMDHGLRELQLFLETYHVSAAYAKRIFKKYADESLTILKENPYRLADDVDGIGFPTADKIAMSLGLDYNAPSRIRAGLFYAMNDGAQEGHCCFPEDEIVKRSIKLLAVPKDTIVESLKACVAEESVVEETFDNKKLYYLQFLYRAECGVAAALKSLANKVYMSRQEGSDLVRGWECAYNKTLAAAQKEAVAMALQHGFFVLTGGPGTGKSTSVKAIVDILERQNKKVLLAAPTGRAAKRLSETTGREAKTIHRLLEYNGMEFGRNEDNPVSADAIIVDEISMVDIFLMNRLLKALPINCRVVFVGDKDQLASVGPGSVLRDILSSKVFPSITLTEIFRQTKGSSVVINAHRINQGKMPNFSEGADFSFYPATSDEVPNVIKRVYAGLIKEGYHPFKDIQVLSPMYKSTSGVNNLNAVLREELNPMARNKKELMIFGRLFRQGDKVMQLKNDYKKEVFNGDIGFVTYASEDMVHVEYPEKFVYYERCDLDSLTPSYACSVHKSQGGEYPAVILVLTNAHYMMLQRNLLYTAMTRGKQKVAIVGEMDAIRKAVHNDKIEQRHSLLAERLKRAL